METSLDMLAGVSGLLQQNLSVTMMKQAVEAERQVAEMLARAALTPPQPDDQYRISVYA